VEGLIYITGSATFDVTAQIVCSANINATIQRQFGRVNSTATTGSFDYGTGSSVSAFGQGSGSTSSTSAFWVKISGTIDANGPIGGLTLTWQFKQNTATAAVLTVGAKACYLEITPEG
jgi:hypothetical protein